MPLLSMPEQSALVHDLIDTIRAELLRDIAAGKVPESWDGIELRQLIADRFASQCGVHMLQRDKPRLRNYRRELIVRNL